MMGTFTSSVAEGVVSISFFIFFMNFRKPPEVAFFFDFVLKTSRILFDLCVSWSEKISCQMLCTSSLPIHFKILMHSFSSTDFEAISPLLKVSKRVVKFQACWRWCVSKFWMAIVSACHANAFTLVFLLSQPSHNISIISGYAILADQNWRAIWDSLLMKPHSCPVLISIVGMISRVNSIKLCDLGCI
jgi:hypothetical protein